MPDPPSLTVRYRLPGHSGAAVLPQFYCGFSGISWGSSAILEPRCNEERGKRQVLEQARTIPRFSASEQEKLESSLLPYRCALKVVETKLSNLNDYYSTLGESNPIEHISCRIKSTRSIAGKLNSRGLPLTAHAATSQFSDIAGARVICSYASNITEIARIIKAQDDLAVVEEKDYLAHPKPSGYRSYHLVVELSPGLPLEAQACRVEIQIRTAAMDFWASLEHKVRYKYGGEVPEHLSDELQACAEKSHELDERMFLIHELVELINE